MTKKPRTLKTPAERAIAALGVEQRRVEKLEARWESLTDQRAVVEDELLTARKRRDYLAQNPDLPEANTDPIPGVDGGAA